MILHESIPRPFVNAAILQWCHVGVCYLRGLLLTYLGAGFLAALTSRKAATHPFGSPVDGEHSLRYRDQGSSGSWEYWNSPIKLLQSWNNLEDGMLGEPSGKHSARCGGKERSLWNRFMWVCRNPYNYAKRTNPFYYCPVNECDIRYWGSQEITDKAPVISGWYFVQATHRKTGRVFYGYRSVRLNDDGTVRQVNLGYKLKPGHAGTVQDPDDADKAFTIRIQFASQAD